MTDDEKFMRCALDLARKGIGQTSPNPAVGAVIVKNGEVIGGGYHHAAGEPHAEVEAMRSLETAGLANGGTLYVTLEPCSTHGRTPPCTDAIIGSGFTRVVIGALDPNPLHAGAACPLLRERRVAVTTGVLEEECRALNRPFNKWITQKLPWVIAKAGMTLEGNIRRAPGRSRWITSEASREHAQTIRARVDAILVGAGTVREDLPRLTVRGIAGARQPWRVVLSRSGNLPADAPLFRDAFREKTLLENRASLRGVLRVLGEREIQSVLIEGGADVLRQAFAEKVVDEVYFYLAPLLTGGSFPALKGCLEELRVREIQYRRIGDDVLVNGLIAH